MAQTKQYYNIKYPLTINNRNGLFIDLDTTKSNGVLSRILHTILTEKGTRLRNPNFGTNLTRFIFDPNISTTWESIEDEVKNAINNYVPEAEIKKISVIRDEGGDDNTILLKMEYSVNVGVTKENKVAVVKL